MLPYIFIILVASFLGYFANKFREVNFFFFLLASACPILILAFFAGARDFDVGFDALYYAKGAFNDAVHSEDFADYNDKNRNELFFLVVNYFVSFISDNFHMALGCISFVTVFFFYCASSRCSDKASFALVLFSVLCLTYANSMNLIRQHMAMGVVFCAYAFLRGKNGGRLFWLLSVAAFLFHKSSIIASLMIWFVNRLSYASDHNKVKSLVWLAVICVGGVALLGPIFKIVAELTGFDKYLAYLETAGNKAGWTKQVFSITWPACCLLISFLSVWAKWRGLIDVRTWFFSISFAILCTSTSMLGLYSEAASRLAYYFYPMVVVGYFTFASSGKFSPGTRFCFNAFSLLVFLFIFVKTFGRHLVYHSEILSVAR